VLPLESVLPVLPLESVLPELPLESVLPELPFESVLSLCFFVAGVELSNSCKDLFLDVMTSSM